MSLDAARRAPRRRHVKRWLVLIPLLVIQLLVTCRWDNTLHKRPDWKLSFVPLAVPSPDKLSELGPFRLDAIWEMKAYHYHFGGYSALVPLPGGRLLAVGDRGWALRFSPPGTPPSEALIVPSAYTPLIGKTGTDSESATRDPATGRIWIGYETSNAIARFSPGNPVPVTAKPPAMAQWPTNRGAEAMARLSDGRFLVMREGFGGRDDDAFFGGNRHEALLFPGDPVTGAKPIRGSLVGPDNFYVTDVAQIPDGRVLILMRRLVWPLPIRLAIRIVIADPAELREGADWHPKLLAKINSTMPMDNFEGLGVVPMTDGKLRIWLISDANSSYTQRTLLWKMTLDPKDLPPRNLPTRDKPAG